MLVASEYFKRIIFWACIGFHSFTQRCKKASTCKLDGLLGNVKRWWVYNLDPTVLLDGHAGLQDEHVLSPLSTGIGVDIMEIPTLELSSLAHSGDREVTRAFSDCIFVSIGNLQAEATHALCDGVLEVSDSKFYFLQVIFDIVIVKFYLYLSVSFAEFTAMQGADTDSAGSWRSL